MPGFENLMLLVSWIIFNLVERYLFVRLERLFPRENLGLELHNRLIL